MNTKVRIVTSQLYAFTNQTDTPECIWTLNLLNVKFYFSSFVQILTLSATNCGQGDKKKNPHF